MAFGDLQIRNTAAREKPEKQSAHYQEASNVEGMGAGSNFRGEAAEAAQLLYRETCDHRARFPVEAANQLRHALGQLVAPGPTHTNVMDVQIALLHP